MGDLKMRKAQHNDYVMTCKLVKLMYVQWTENCVWCGSANVKDMCSN